MTCPKALNLAADIPGNELCKACVINHNTLGNYKGETRPVTSAEERHRIYSKPIEEQFEPVFINGNAEVVKHILKSTESEDYERVLDVAKAMAVAKDGKIWILPEIHKSETAFREMLGLSTENGYTPDIMLTIGDFVDVKSPFSKKKISSNACDAYRQGGKVCITSHRCNLNITDIDSYAKWVLDSQGYLYDVAYFYIGGKIIKKTRE